MEECAHDTEMLNKAEASGTSPSPSSLATGFFPGSTNLQVDEIYLLTRKELYFGPNHAHTAMALADLDGDGQQEFMVGSLDGTLAIYKGLAGRVPWAVATGLGMLRVFSCGQLLPDCDIETQSPLSKHCSEKVSGEKGGKAQATAGTRPARPKQLVALTVEGDVHLFDFKNDPSLLTLTSPTKPSYAEKHGGRSSPAQYTDVPVFSAWDTPSLSLQPSHSFTVAPNVTAALILDVDGDGCQELVLGYTDGKLQVLGWRSAWRLTEDAGPDDSRPCSERVPGGAPVQMFEKGVATASASIVSLSSLGADDSSERPECIAVGLEAGTIEVLRCSSGAVGDREPLLTSLVELQIGGGLPLPRFGWSGPLTCCALPKDVDSRARGLAFAVAGLDGRMGVAVVGKEGGGAGEESQAADEGGLGTWKTVWSVQTRHPLYTVAPLFLGTGDEGRGFAACAWSGLTYWVLTKASSAGQAGAEKVRVFDPSKMLMPPVRGFLAGAFGPDNEPCLFYSCADGHIVVFHELEKQLRRLQKGTEEYEEEVAKAARELRAPETQELVDAWVKVHLTQAGETAGGVDEGETPQAEVLEPEEGKGGP